LDNFGLSYSVKVRMDLLVRANISAFGKGFPIGKVGEDISVGVFFGEGPSMVSTPIVV